MFKDFFKKTDTNKSNLKRIDLIDKLQIDEILKLSQQKPVLLFKHSTQCGISSIILRRFESKIADKIDHYNYYYLDLLQYRSISDFVAEKFDIPHQSPQLITIRNGRVSEHNSHNEIMDVTF
jgi:monothiol bacilliredoxin